MWHLVHNQGIVRDDYMAIKMESKWMLVLKLQWLYNAPEQENQLPAFDIFCYIQESIYNIDSIFWYYGSRHQILVW